MSYKKNVLLEWHFEPHQDSDTVSVNFDKISVNSELLIFWLNLKHMVHRVFMVPWDIKLQLQNWVMVPRLLDSGYIADCGRAIYNDHSVSASVFTNGWERYWWFQIVNFALLFYDSKTKTTISTIKKKLSLVSEVGPP